MPKYTLQFIVMIDGPSSDRAIIDAIRTPFRDPQGNVLCGVDLSGNYVEILANDDADRSKMSGEAGFLYYGFELRATPTKSSIQEAEQIQLARELRLALERQGWKVVICANFEDKLQ